MIQLTYKSFPNITFPCYQLYSENLVYKDGLLFLEGQILDDQNMGGDTLGQRRLQTPHKDLYRLNNQIDGIPQIARTRRKIFIDTQGKCFRYKKTEFLPLRHHKIEEVHLRDTYSILQLEGCALKFSIASPPPLIFNYASVIHWKDSPWFLYGYSQEYEEESVRLI